MVDPDEERTLDEMIQHAWEHKLSDTQRARVLADAAAEGLHWFELVVQRMEEIVEEMNDPLTGPRWLTRFDAARFPVGKDPLLQRSEP